MNKKINFIIGFITIFIVFALGFVGYDFYNTLICLEYPYSLGETKLPESPAIIISEDTHPAETYFVVDPLNPFIAISAGYELVMIDSSESLHVFLTDTTLSFPKERWRR